MVGQTISHYTVLQRVGIGAMGEVYKAEDARLQRFVALKVMARDLPLDAGTKRRFIQEARAASALDHPNICAVHDIGELDDGRLYLVMTLYEGETLASVIGRGPIAVQQASTIARQIASGLSRAHDYGIVHRDIKPANLFVTRFGEVKILDFGLAKLKSDVLDTQAGVLLGTLPYMSPERVAGGPVDHRSDIWSLGAVLYEMLTGRRPFQGDSSAAVIHSIVYDELPPILDLRRDIPPRLVEIVDRTLQKSPASRFQSCQDFARALAGDEQAIEQDAWESSALAHRRSVLVMPFVSLGPEDTESQFFANGLTDEVITDLSRVDALRVIARTASERVRASGRSFKEVARELGVEYVVDGAVRRHGTAVRVSANLIEVRSGSLLWAEQFSGVLEDIFTIQQTLSQKIVAALRVRLGGDQPLRVEAALPRDVHAYEYYLKAKQEFVRYSPDGLARALKYIEAARARAGDNVLLLAAAGQIYWQLVNSGSSADRQYLGKARDCAERILALERESSHGLRLLGMVRLLEGDIRATIALLESSAAKDPNDTDTLSLLGPCWGYVGRPQAGLSYVTRLLELDPLTPMYQAMPGILALMAGSFDEAVEPFATSYRLDPGNPLVGLLYGQCLGLNGNISGAIDIFDELQHAFQDGFMARLGQLYKCAWVGRHDEAARWVSPEVEAIANWDLYHSWNLAQCYSLLGDADRGLKWLARSAERGMLNYPLLARLDPFLERLRADARFEPLVAQVKQYWEDLTGASAPTAPLIIRTQGLG